jgi:hypothetical protein
MTTSSPRVDRLNVKLIKMPRNRGKLIVLQIKNINAQIKNISEKAVIF